MMATNKVVLYFESHEDALRFTVAAGAVMAGDTRNSATDVVRQVERASRITAQGALGNERVRGDN